MAYSATYQRLNRDNSASDLSETLVPTKAGVEDHKDTPRSFELSLLATVAILFVNVALILATIIMAWKLRQVVHVSDINALPRPDPFVGLPRKL